MIRIIFALSLYFAILQSSFSIEILIEREGGGEEGKFNEIKEEHIPGGWFSDDESRLVCKDNGNMDFMFHTNPSEAHSDNLCESESISRWEDLKEIAETNIKNGVLEGSYSIVKDGSGYLSKKVTWSSKSTNPNEKSTITIKID